MKKIFYSILLLAGTSSALFAQYEQDALSYSRTFFGGSARSMAMGGAQTAVGADMGNLAGNPAGLAFYRRGDLNISPGLTFNSTESNYLGNTSADGRGAIKIGSMGMVLAAPNVDYKGAEKTSGCVSWAFGFGMNKINNFSEQFTIQGQNDKSSLNTSFLQAATADGLQKGTYQSLAYDAYLLDVDSVTGKISGLAEHGGTFQQERRTRKGAQTQWTLAGGANFDNRLYWGASLNLIGVNYTSSAQYSETGINDTAYTYALKAFDLQDRLEQSGTGFNIKTGIIFRPIDLIRIGASVQSPTYYRINESSSVTLFSTDINNDQWHANNGDESLQSFSYNLTTPAKVEAGMALFFGKLGMLSADMEHIDYGAALFKSNSTAVFDLNTNASIRKAYLASDNYRVGGELKLGDLSFRAGYALYGNPYTYSSGTDRFIPFYTGGFGIKSEDSYFDLSLVNTQRQFTYTPYNLNDGSEPKGTITSTSTSFLVTIGTRF